MYGLVGIAFNQGVTITDSSIEAGTVVSINNTNLKDTDTPLGYNYARGAAGNINISSTALGGDAITAQINITIGNDFRTGTVGLDNMTLTGTQDIANNVGASIVITSWGDIDLNESLLQTAWTTPDASGSGSINLRSHTGTEITDTDILAGTEIEIKNLDMASPSYAATGAITTDDNSTISSSNSSIFVQNVAGFGGDITLESDQISAHTDITIRGGRATDPGAVITIGDDLTDTMTATTGKIDILATSGHIVTNAILSADTNVIMEATGGGHITINNNMTATQGYIDVDTLGILAINDATLSAINAGADIMLNAGEEMTLTNSTVTGDRNVWLHTTGYDGHPGNITFTNSGVTSNNGAVDVYAAFNGDAMTPPSTIDMDAASSITATAAGDHVSWLETTVATFVQAAKFC